eukprot:scaffold2145_cov136-Skeletonema_menzelii.AAC.4
MGDSRGRNRVLAASGGQHVSSQHLRVRSKRRKANQEHRFMGIIRNECFPALVPVLAIFGVYLFVCWIMVWISMYKSLNDIGDDHEQHHFNKRNDIIAMRLEQFLSGRRTALDNSDSQNQHHFSLSQIIDQDNAKQIQSSLLAKTGYPQLTLGAYLEPPLSIDEAGNMKARVHTPQDLTHVTYPLNERNGACSKNGAQWMLPTSHPMSLDNYFGGNVFRKHPMYDKRWELANGTAAGVRGVCPVDADPYLPWIHDVFPSNDGTNIVFVISNKRRCNTDTNVFKLDLENLEPQVGNMQPIPVKRIISGNLTQQSDFLAGNTPRYSLATSIEEADEDGRATKFICRFHTVDTDLKQVVLGETLSNYPYNPEHLNYRKKGSKPMLTSLDKGHDEQIWNSVYQISCPVPQKIDANGLSLTSIIASGQSVSMQGIPSIYVDLVPIRTPVRRSREGFGIPGISSSFDPKVVWGDASIIPLVEDSGRWSNIPICNTPRVDEQLEVDTIPTSDAPLEFHDNASGTSEKKHFLVACVWTAQSFSTRGQTSMTDSSEDRLLEFLTYHTQIAGFDHVYVYDNSDTSLSDSTLAAVTDMFPKKLVSRIAWPHRVCNNNRPAHSNPGERSSQYAAEASCRARYGEDTSWMASLDADEYLIPTGKWKNLRDWLDHVTANEEKTQILSFFQTRALPNVDVMVPYDGKSIQACKTNGVHSIDNLPRCLMKNRNKTYMETYNCEPTTHPKPQSWAWRAKKQIYRPEFVLNHFVHYSVSTRQIIDSPDLESFRFNERAPFERRVHEIEEGFLLHTKSTLPEMTLDWHSKCPRKAASGSIKDCKVGMPSSDVLGVDTASEESRLIDTDNLVSAKYESNCYPHFRVKRFIPALEEAMKKLTSV